MIVTPAQVLLVLVGGGIGSVARYLVGTWMLDRFGAGFPWGTLTVNVVGSFLIGVIAVLADERGALGPHVRTFLIVGVLGGFTTFSAFSYETMRLLADGSIGASFLNVAGQFAVGLVAVRGLAGA